MLSAMILIMALSIGIISFTVLVDAFSREIAHAVHNRIPHRVQKIRHGKHSRR